MEVADSMIVWTRNSWWRWVLAEKSILIVRFVLHCLTACLVVAPYLVPHRLFAPPHHNFVVECRSLGCSHFRVDFSSALIHCCNPFWLSLLVVCDTCRVSLYVVVVGKAWDRWLAIATFIASWHWVSDTTNSVSIAEPSTCTCLFLAQYMKER